MVFPIGLGGILAADPDCCLLDIESVAVAQPNPGIFEYGHSGKSGYCHNNAKDLFYQTPTSCWCSFITDFYLTYPDPGIKPSKIDQVMMIRDLIYLY